MRRRWQFNTEALAGIGVAWFVVGLVVCAANSHDDPKPPHGGHPAPWWMFAVWFAPYVLLVAALALRALWAWLRSADGWFVRRVWEPVTDDLRERGE